MDGATSLLSGPLRPIPMHCGHTRALDPGLFSLPAPHPGLDLRLPWKTPLLSPLPAPPHPLALVQQLRRHHSLLTSDRLMADVILPKTSPSLALTSPLSAGLPALSALHALLPRSAPGGGGLAPRGDGDRLAVPGSGSGSRPAPVAAAPAPVSQPQPHPPAPFSHPLLVSGEAGSPGTSPYGRKLFPCPQCRYTTDRRNNLKRHMLTMHQLSAKLLECCGVLFHTKAALREHALVFHYHGYTCFYCGRRFCRKALLKRHLSVHNGQKEFLCNVCDYATSHKSNLERHRRVHVRQDGDPGLDHEEALLDDDDVMDGRVSTRDDAEPLSDDVKSTVSETNSHVDVSCDELSVCSDDEDEEINVHSD